MTAAATQPRLTREQKARQMGRQGYTLSESIKTVGVFLIGKRGAAEPYIVDVAGETCTCMDYCRNGAPCKHQLFVALCCRWWKTLEAIRVVKVRNRRRFSAKHLAQFSAKHLAQFRALAPKMAAPAPVVSAKKYGSTEYKQMMSGDFC